MIQLTSDPTSGGLIATGSRTELAQIHHVLVKNDIWFEHMTLPTAMAR